MPAALLAAMLVSSPLAADDALPASTLDLLLYHEGKPLATPSLGASGSQAPGNQFNPHFELAADDAQTLRLQWRQPLFFEISSSQLGLSNGSSLLDLGGTAGIGLGDEVSLELSVDETRTGQVPFQALGNIQCEDGFLAAGSYHATNCQFVSGQDSLHSSAISLGPSYQPNESVRLKASYFQQQARVASGQPLMLTDPTPLAPWDSMHMAWGSDAPLLPGMLPGQFSQSSAEGVDLDLQLGFRTNQAGEIQVGFQFARVMEAELDSLSPTSGTPLNWSPLEPFNSAQLNVDWHKGDFSAGIHSYYRDPLVFRDRQQLDSLTSFDVHFTWRTPWNALLSIGASNALEAGTDGSVSENNESIDDPFRMIYGRVPYVRYEQDL